jgi:lysozyme
MAKKKAYKRKKKKISPKSDKRWKQVALALVFLSILSICVFYLIKWYKSEPNTFESNKYYVKGVDVSHHNPILNWEEALNQNITFAYLKATEGNTHEDRNYPYNYDLAKKANIKVGAYHFYTFGLSGKEQASHFIKIAQCKSGDMIPAIDVEHSPSNPYSKDKKYRAIVVEELKALEQALFEHYGVHPVIYTNKDCYKHYVKDNFPHNLLWISDLHNEPSDDIENWRIWQFSHNGELPGMIGDIDLNYYRYSYEDFKELLLP